MTRLLIALAAFALFASASFAAEPEPDLRVELRPVAEDAWTVEYRFKRAAPAWLFPRTHPTLDGRNWRAEAWRVETPGVRLTRRGRYDVLESTNGRPLKTVRLRVRPLVQDLRADYLPVLPFSDGGAAVFVGHYEVIPLKEAALADGLPDDLNGHPLDGARGTFTVRKPRGRLLAAGRAYAERATLPLDASTYVYFGASKLIETDAVAAVVDPGLPAWLKAELDGFTPRLLAAHREQLGASSVGRPVLFAAWRGAAREGRSMNGGALHGLISMSFEGKQLLNADPAVAAQVRWFVGHETAHFWVGQTIRHERFEDAWITEGAADVLAVRTLAGLDPSYAATARLQESVDGCLRITQPGEALKDALRRNEHKAQYDCGAVLLLAAEAGLRRNDPGGDAATFWRALIEENRADGVVTSEDWLTAFRRATGDAALTEEVRRFIAEGAADPAAFVRALFERSGVAFEVRPQGRLVLL